MAKMCHHLNMTGPELPPLPDAYSDLGETKKYLDALFESHLPISVRTLISIWGCRARSQRMSRAINHDLEKMGYTVTPPLESGTLDTFLALQSFSDSESDVADANHPDEHMLTMTLFPSAVLATQEKIAADITADAGGNEETSMVLCTASATDSVAEVVTRMLRYDFSQVPIMDPVNSEIPIGVFSWRSFAGAVAIGNVPETVGSAMEQPRTVDLHSDIFTSTSLIAAHDYCLVSYHGRLSGIVTSSDLIGQLEDLAIPFLAVGRAELELKRVAKYFGLSSEKKIDQMMFGQLQSLFANEWSRLGWMLDKDTFLEWVDAARRLRNAVAHHDEPTDNFTGLMDQVHGMVRWLANVGRVDTLDNEGKAD